MSGFTLNSMKILCGTIKAYMSVVNIQYKRTIGITVGAKGDSPSVVLEKTQENYEKKPGRQAPLTVHMIVWMCELTQKDPLGFKA